MACCGGNKDDMEREDVVQDLEAGVDEYENSEVAGHEQSFGKSLLFSSGNLTMYVVIGVLGLLLAVGAIIVVYRGIYPSFEKRANDLKEGFESVKVEAHRPLFDK
eukprot:3859_1